MRSKWIILATVLICLAAVVVPVAVSIHSELALREEVDFAQGHGLSVNVRNDPSPWRDSAGEWWNRFAPEAWAIRYGSLRTTTVDAVFVFGRHSSSMSNLRQSPHLLRAVRRLDIRASRIEDADLPSFEQAKQLTEVTMLATKISEAALESFFNCRTLENILIIDSGGISATGLRKLAALPRLKIIGLTGPQFDEAALATLSSSTSLQEIYISPHIFSAAAVQEFERTHPGWTIKVPLQGGLRARKLPSP